MDIRTLKYFVVVAEELNITKAAERLSMCQPPLSMAMKALENELSTTLFIRSKKSLKLTESGQLLYRRAKEIIALTVKSEEEIKMINNGMQGTISLGLVEGMAPNIAAEWVSAFTNTYPNVKFRIHDGNTDDLTDKLRSGIISLAVVSAPYDTLLLNSIKVGEESYVVFMNKNHILNNSDRKTVTIDDLVGEKLTIPARESTKRMVEKWFKKIGKASKIVCETDSYIDFCALAEKMNGLSICTKTEYVPNQSLVVKEIEGVEKEQYFFVWIKGRPLQPLDEAFIDYVSDCSKGIIKEK